MDIKGTILRAKDGHPVPVLEREGLKDILEVCMMERLRRHAGARKWRQNGQKISFCLEWETVGLYWNLLKRCQGRF